MDRMYFAQGAFTSTAQRCGKKNPNSIMKTPHPANKSEWNAVEIVATATGHPLASRIAGAFIWLMPTSTPQTIHAIPSRGRTATTQKPARSENHGARIHDTAPKKMKNAVGCGYTARNGIRASMLW